MVINVKRLTIHYACGCWGKPEELYSDHGIFSAREVKFIRKYELATKKGPNIEIKYNPHNMATGYLDNVPLEYSKDFNEMCDIACKLINKTEPAHICDALGTSLEILFENGEKFKFDLNSKEYYFLIIQLMEFSFKYMPEFFKENFDENLYCDEIA